MSQLQRHKFNVQHNGLGRKTSLILILHKVKPLIYKRYVSHLLKKKEVKYELQNRLREISHDIGGGEQRAVDHIRSNIETIATIWQCRLKSASKKRLPIMKNVQEPSFDESPVDKLNKLMELPYYRFEELEFVNPNRRFRSHLQSPSSSLMEPIRGKYFINFENLMTPTRFVVALPEHRFGKRVEIDLENDPDAIELINLQLYLYECHHENDPNIISLDTYEIEQPRDDHCIWHGIKSFDYFSIFINGFALMEHGLFRARMSKENFGAVLTYFLIFCVLGLLAVIFPYP